MPFIAEEIYKNLTGKESVHLADFPTSDKKLIDEKLNRNMEAVREIISIGLQNKILQAMAMKIPCVISTMANNALGATHEKEVFVANTPEEYMRYIQLLLTDKEKYNQLTDAAYNFVRKNFNWEQSTKDIIQKINS